MISRLLCDNRKLEEKVQAAEEDKVELELRLNSAYQQQDDLYRHYNQLDSYVRGIQQQVHMHISGKDAEHAADLARLQAENDVKAAGLARLQDQHAAKIARLQAENDEKAAELARLQQRLEKEKEEHESDMARERDAAAKLKKSVMRAFFPDGKIDVSLLQQ